MKNLQYQLKRKDEQKKKSYDIMAEQHFVLELDYINGFQFKKRIMLQ